MSEPHTKAEWDAYHALPEWEVTVVMARTARLRAHAGTAEEAEARVLRRENGVRAMEDLDDAEGLSVISVAGIREVRDGE